jgi:hypothetical protein
MKDTYDKLFKNAVKFSALVIAYIIFAVLFLYVNADRNVAKVEQYMKGTVLLYIMTTAFAKGMIILIKIFLVFASMIGMLLHLLLHYIARRIWKGKRTGRRQKACGICLLIAFIVDILLFLLVLVLSIQDIIVPIILGFMIFMNVKYERRLWKEGASIHTNEGA